MMRSTSDKAAQERLKKEINNSHIQEVVQTIKMVTEKTARYQQKLEEKQAENLRAIKEKEGQLQQEALAEYKEKLERLECGGAGNGEELCQRRLSWRARDSEGSCSERS
ncbi:1-phosphatidylinositol 4,5-bisphosphate phosphodiesterase beta-2-like [Phaenicophaeus curvirostris]|uniref:1-phosphatidylinositol 4,5-bisphosphate phosphodiesterase beta-2-like n=1 Tax=Phaenicophaeus curvirostris TaxID=33595 RepID=UPI0037F0E85D